MALSVCHQTMNELAWILCLGLEPKDLSPNLFLWAFKRKIQVRQSWTDLVHVELRSIEEAQILKFTKPPLFSKCYMSHTRNSSLIHFHSSSVILLFWLVRAEPSKILYPLDTPSALWSQTAPVWIMADKNQICDLGSIDWPLEASAFHNRYLLGLNPRAYWKTLTWTWHIIKC